MKHSLCNVTQDHASACTCGTSYVDATSTPAWACPDNVTLRYLNSTLVPLRQHLDGADLGSLRAVSKQLVACSNAVISSLQATLCAVEPHLDDLPGDQHRSSGGQHPLPVLLAKLPHLTHLSILESPELSAPAQRQHHGRQGGFTQDGVAADTRPDYGINVVEDPEPPGHHTCASCTAWAESLCSVQAQHLASLELSGLPVSRCHVARAAAPCAAALPRSPGAKAAVDAAGALFGRAKLLRRLSVHVQGCCAACPGQPAATLQHSTTMPLQPAEDGMPADAAGQGCACGLCSVLQALPPGLESLSLSASPPDGASGLPADAISDGAASGGDSSGLDSSGSCTPGSSGRSSRGTSSDGSVSGSTASCSSSRSCYSLSASLCQRPAASHAKHASFALLCGLQRTAQSLTTLELVGLPVQLALGAVAAAAGHSGGLGLPLLSRLVLNVEGHMPSAHLATLSTSLPALQHLTIAERRQQQRCRLADAPALCARTPLSVSALLQLLRHPQLLTASLVTDRYLSTASRQRRSPSLDLPHADAHGALPASPPKQRPQLHLHLQLPPGLTTATSPSPAAHLAPPAALKPSPSHHSSSSGSGSSCSPAVAADAAAGGGASTSLLPAGPPPPRLQRLTVSVCATPDAFAAVLAALPPTLEHLALNINTQGPFLVHRVPGPGSDRPLWISPPPSPTRHAEAAGTAGRSLDQLLPDDDSSAAAVHDLEPALQQQQQGARLVVCGLRPGEARSELLQLPRRVPRLRELRLAGQPASVCNDALLAAWAKHGSTAALVMQRQEREHERGKLPAAAAAAEGWAVSLSLLSTAAPNAVTCAAARALCGALPALRSVRVVLGGRLTEVGCAAGEPSASA